MEENYYALLICILKPVTIEQGFDLLEGHISNRYNLAITGEDIEDMIRMKQQGMTYREIGSYYGISEEAAYRRIKRYKAKKG
ncbi:MAG: hypothetical protein K0R92_372 [Lachnospiraceae bacterium]|nr:hypothetical protein [Lachnospiraceae bacterium]